METEGAAGITGRRMRWASFVALLVQVGGLTFGSGVSGDPSASDQPSPIPTMTRSSSKAPPRPDRAPSPSRLDSSRTVLEPLFSTHPSPWMRSPPQRPTLKTQSFGDYSVRLERRNSDWYMDHVEIRHQGRIAYAQDDEQGGFSIGHRYDDPDVNPEPSAMGRDITGDGVPNVVIAQYTGGAHCCLYFHVFELGDTLRHVATLDAGHGDLSRFEDLDGDGILEFLTWDRTWEYFGHVASFVESPFPRLILRYASGNYDVAEDLMRQPAPHPGDYRDIAGQLINADSWNIGHPPAALWQAMVDLIYTGNAETAWALFADTWKGSRTMRREDAASFDETLQSSPYWSGISQLNGGKVLSKDWTLQAE